MQICIWNDHIWNIWNDHFDKGDGLDMTVFRATKLTSAPMGCPAEGSKKTYKPIRWCTYWSRGTFKKKSAQKVDYYRFVEVNTLYNQQNRKTLNWVETQWNDKASLNFNVCYVLGHTISSKMFSNTARPNMDGRTPIIARLLKQRQEAL